MLTSDYQFHHRWDTQVSQWDRVEAVFQRKAAMRTAALVVAADVAAFALLIWSAV